MTRSSMRNGTAILAIALLMTAPTAAQTLLPVNEPTSVNGVTAVCTGIGSDQDAHPEWQAFPLKIVVVGKEGQYLADADITLAQGKKTVAAMHCDAPWVLVKLAPGRYRVSASHNGEVVVQTATAPAKGQGSVILRFANRGGVVSPEHTQALKDDTAQ